MEPLNVKGRFERERDLRERKSERHLKENQGNERPGSCSPAKKRHLEVALYARVYLSCDCVPVVQEVVSGGF